jgi:hypothetical protein
MQAKMESSIGYQDQACMKGVLRRILYQAEASMKNQNIEYKAQDGMFGNNEPAAPTSAPSTGWPLLLNCG